MAAECLIQSAGTPETFLLDDGRTYELRCGCLVDAETRCMLADSEKAPAVIVRRGILSSEQLLKWAEFGPAICASAAMAATKMGWGPCA